MLAAPATGPSISPASTTTSGCSVIGTGVNGSGIATCDAAASTAAKPTMPIVVTRPSRDGRTAVERVLIVSGKFEEGVRSRSLATLGMTDGLIDQLDAEGDGISAAEAERGET